MPIFSNNKQHNVLRYALLIHRWREPRRNGPPSACLFFAIRVTIVCFVARPGCCDSCLWCMPRRTVVYERAGMQIDEGTLTSVFVFLCSIIPSCARRTCTCWYAGFTSSRGSAAYATPSSGWSDACRERSVMSGIVPQTTQPRWLLLACSWSRRSLYAVRGTQVTANPSTSFIPATGASLLRGTMWTTALSTVALPLACCSKGSARRWHYGGRRRRPSATCCGSSSIHRSADGPVTWS